MKIGIVGGAGYIGSQLAKHLGKKFQVRVIDQKPMGSTPENGEYVQCNIQDLHDVRRSLKGLDLVVHTAIIQIPRINEEKSLGYEVNIIGTQNICETANETRSIRGLLLAGTWHTIGEREIIGTIDESFGYRPDKVEERARLYALSKILQEGIVRFYDELSEKIFGIVRMGTVLGEGMPKQTAASRFIENGLNGSPITPYKHSMHRPMLYVDISDVCKTFEGYAVKILNGEVKKGNNSLHHIVNIVYPKPLTILELAETVRESINELTMGRLCPEIKIVDKGIPSLFHQDEKKKFRIDITKAMRFLELQDLVSPRESIRELIRTSVIAPTQEMAYAH